MLVGEVLGQNNKGSRAGWADCSQVYFTPVDLTAWPCQPGADWAGRGKDTTRDNQGEIELEITSHLLFSPLNLQLGNN